MKMFFILFVALSFVGSTNAQAVGIGTTTPAASAILETNSTSKGFLPPRMTMAQRNAISSPTQGLIIFCTNCGAGEIEIYSGVDWRNMIGGPVAPLLAIGNSYGGGKVAYILQSGDPGYIAGQVHGLIAAVSDQSTGAPWGCSGTNIPGAEGIALGTGNQNTTDIVNGCSTPGIAARICYDLVLGGYSDWYLPSKDELNKMYINSGAIGGFSFLYYWSSSETGGFSVWVQEFSAGDYFQDSKANNNYVRAVRAF